ncbi:8982_t:CDS:2, partial [Diversispora eburnea]
AQSCIDYPNPTNPCEQVAVKCPPTDKIPTNPCEHLHTITNNDVYIKRQTTNFFQVYHICSSTAALYDKITRRYPQALVKQFPLNIHPGYNDFDIIASFNTDTTGLTPTADFSNNKFVGFTERIFDRYVKFIQIIPNK